MIFRQGATGQNSVASCFKQYGRHGIIKAKHEI